MIEPENKILKELIIEPYEEKLPRCVNRYEFLSKMLRCGKLSTISQLESGTNSSALRQSTL